MTWSLLVNLTCVNSCFGSLPPVAPAWCRSCQGSSFIHLWSAQLWAVQELQLVRDKFLSAVWGRIVMGFWVLFICVGREYILFSQINRWERERKDILTSEERTSLENESKDKKDQVIYKCHLETRHACVSVVFRCWQVCLCAWMSIASYLWQNMQVLFSHDWLWTYIHCLWSIYFNTLIFNFY